MPPNDRLCPAQVDREKQRKIPLGIFVLIIHAEDHAGGRALFKEPFDLSTFSDTGEISRGPIVNDSVFESISLALPFDAVPRATADGPEAAIYDTSI
jgi:hypothetical protein